MGVGQFLPGRCPLALDGLTDTLDQKDLKYKGYQLSVERNPTFNYQYKGITFSESFKAGSSPGLERVTLIKNPTGKKFSYRLAQGNSISSVGNGLYAIDGQRYYLRVADPSSYKIVSNNGLQELIFESSQTELKVASTLIF
jgi:hypothetical protein